MKYWEIGENITVEVIVNIFYIIFKINIVYLIYMFMESDSFFNRKGIRFLFLVG